MNKVNAKNIVIKRYAISFISLLLVVCSLFCFVACGNNGIDTTYDIVKKTKSNNFALLNETATKGQAVMIGDSIVELFPTELFENMNIKVYNRGISGDTSDRMLERIESNALSAKPRALSILVGTNDQGRGIKDEVIVENIKQSIEKAKIAKVEKIVVQSVYPINWAINSNMVGGRKNDAIEALNVKIKAMCDANGVTYVDVFSALKDSEGKFKSELTYDGLHPNAAGFKVIAGILKPYFTFN